jgi:hypothetical protein
MHKIGSRMTNEHFRNGKVVQVASVEVWDFSQNGAIPVIQAPYQVLPGDSFRTSCYYRDEGKTVFGLSSRQEMCIAILYYYPRKSLTIQGYDLPFQCAMGYEEFFPQCAEVYEPVGLKVYSELNRKFGELMPQCETSPADQPTTEAQPAVPPVASPTSSAWSTHGTTNSDWLFGAVFVLIGVVRCI